MTTLTVYLALKKLRHLLSLTSVNYGTVTLAVDSLLILYLNVSPSSKLIYSGSAQTVAIQPQLRNPLLLHKLLLLIIIPPTQFKRTTQKIYSTIAKLTKQRLHISIIHRDKNSKHIPPLLPSYKTKNHGTTSIIRPRSH